ncbi:MAG: histidine kinase [Cyclobacteriaceae bacterium]|nr:histidine kinase [Cyclobacteriaceae bacterium]
MRIVLHIGFWVLIWLWMTTVYIYDIADLEGFLQFNLMRLPVIIAATYAVIHFVVYKNLVASPPRYVRAALLFLLIFLAASTIDRFISGTMISIPTLLGETLNYTFINPLPILKNTFLLLSILGMATAVQFYNYTHQQQKQIHALHEEKLKTELSFLRSQINPHFLFNIFNNMYSLASRNGQDELAKALSGISGVMRYITYESNVSIVPVHKEVQLLQSFIELQRLRIGDSDEALINFKTEGDLNHSYISPVLLLPLVENAFKHGLEPGQPTLIDISLSVDNNQLVFEVKNRIHSATEKNVGGIGLANLRKRLQNIYPGKHEMDISQEKDIFKVHLRINLNAEAKE